MSIFLSEVVSGSAADREIHIILDNLSAHKTKLVAAFLERDVIARGIFTSPGDLARKLRRYITAYSKAAKPFRWKYSKPSRRIRYGKTSSKTVH